jgi:hypothetical protein
MDAISLSLNKEMAKENQPKGLMPFGIPQCKNGAARGPMFLQSIKNSDFAPAF